MDVQFYYGSTGIPGSITQVGKKYILRFKYHPGLVDYVKSMKSARWDPENKAWSVPICERNDFQLAVIKGDNPYSQYDIPLIDFTPTRKLYAHQREMVSHILTRRYCLLACEMGTGKTLVAIEALENLNLEGEVWYIAPKSGIEAVKREFRKWECKVNPLLFTYESVVKLVNNWPYGAKSPQALIIDESSKVKNPTAKRSEAVFHVASAVRSEWDDKGVVVLMSGTPAPRTPVDWWHQCEIARPGYLKEGDIHKFRKKLAVVIQKESMAGGVYPEIVTWRDNELKCDTCGRFQAEHSSPEREGHIFTHSKNEIARLYNRMNGLVKVKFKKDCVDLPEIIYEEIVIPPTPDMLRLAKSIKEKSTRVIESLTKLRELSDGFLYQDIEDGKIPCPGCNGTGVITIPEEGECYSCFGTGFIDKYKRGVQDIGTPKDAKILEELDIHEEVGRIIIWAGFMGSIDRLTDIIVNKGWNVIRVDGRGFKTFTVTGEEVDYSILLDSMDYSHKDYDKLLDRFDKVCFLGNPQAGGMALTLTASPTEIFYSNSFDGTARMQAEARFHRIGMDVNRGAVIKDFIVLPTDRLVLKNLKLKRSLQAISMGDIENVWREASI